MGELFRVRQNVDCLNTAVGYIQRDDRIRFSIEITDYARRSIDPRRPAQQCFRQKLPKRTQYSADDIVGTADKVGNSNCFPASIGVEYDNVRQQTQQAFHMPHSYGLEKALQQIILLLCGGFKARPHRAYMLACSPQNLTAIHFILTQNSSDFGVFILEHFVEKEHCTFDWSQAFKQYQECHG